MAFKLLSLLVTLALLEMNVAQSIDSIHLPKQSLISAKSCLDLLRMGFKTDGIYKIRVMDTMEIITVYCDMNSEPGSAWTLVMSYAWKNRLLEQFHKKALKQDAPVNELSPNFDIYRMSLSQMKHLKLHSSHWRVTCDCPAHKVDYSDYVRANFAHFDVMSFLGLGICKKVEFVNIRGFQCAHCTSKWWQLVNKYAPHIDSSDRGCDLYAGVGSTMHEDNFGYYESRANKKFRCTATALSKTNWWFGGYL